MEIIDELQYHDYLNEQIIDKEDSNSFAELTKLKQVKSLKRKSFFTFDTETKDGLKGKELFCFSYAHAIEKSNAKKKIDAKWVIDYEQRIKSKCLEYKDDNLGIFINDVKGRKDKQSIVFVHNLGFDVRFIADYCARHQIDTIPIISGSATIAYVLPSFYIKFVDSLQFLQCSQDKAELEWLENYPELRKIECKDLFEKEFKLWSENDKRRVIEHNKMDVKALYAIMNEFRNTMFEVGNIDVLQIISIAGLAMKAFRKCLTQSVQNPFVSMVYCPNNIKRKVNYVYDKELDTFVRSSYFGGRCEIFDTNLHENCVYVDKVSMYPYVMQLKKYPFGIGYWETSEKVLHNLIQSRDLREGFIECNVIPNKFISKYPILPEKRAMKTTFSNCEKVAKVYALPELRKAFQLGYWIEPIKGYIFNESKKIFEGFINKFFEIKKNSVGGKRKSSKIIMNGSYGKFGQAFERMGGNFTYFADKEKWDELAKEVSNDSKYYTRWDNEKGCGWVCENKNSVVIKPFMNVAIASYVTAYARLELWEQLHELEQKRVKVYYCDCDSFTIQKNDLKFIQLGKELGNWDIEHEFEEVKFIALKCYIFREKGKIHLKLKGVERNKMKEIEDSSKTIDEILIKIKEPIQLAEKYMSFNEAHRSGIILNTKIRAKHYSYENLKREFSNDGTSRPWNDITIQKYPILCK